MINIFINKKVMFNPKLKPGDRVRIIYMEGETLTPGTWGTVLSHSVLFGDDQYYVSWDDGDKDNVGELISKLAIISNEDVWTTSYKKLKK